MRERIRLQALVIFSVFSLIVCGQNNTSSPYSRYGLNTTENMGYSLSGGMGGAGVALRSPYYINPLNPASYSSLDSQNVVVEAGFFWKGSTLNDGTKSEYTKDANFQYFAMAFPVTKRIGTSVGMRPYSFVGYEYYSIDSTNTTGKMLSHYYGGGSINQAYWGTAYRPFNALSFGVSFSYLFGKVYHNRNLVFEDPTIRSSNQKTELYLHNLMFEFGSQYTLKLKNSGIMTIGATFSPYVDASSTLTNTTFTPLDTIIHSTGNNVKLPQRWGVGIAYAQNHWLATADYRKEHWNKNYFMTESEVVTDNARYSLGVQYTNDPYSRAFFKRLKYRGGFHFSNTNIEIKGHQINEVGMSFGVGVPIRSIKTTMNLALELGKRGTTQYGLIEENYAKLMVSFAFNDMWFFKRRFE